MCAGKCRGSGAYLFYILLVMRRIRMKKTLVMAAAAVLTGSMAYPSLAEEYVFEMAPVVVTANRMNENLVDARADISVVTSRQIEKLHLNTVEDALRTVPGTQYLNYGGNGLNANLSGIRINGSKDIILLVDGVRVTDFNGANNSGYMYSSLLNNMDNVERIEVLRGSAGALYGSGAKGGVINIITKNPGEKKTTVDIARGTGGREIYKLTTMGRVGKFSYMAYYDKLLIGDTKSGDGRLWPGHTHTLSDGVKFAYDFTDKHSLSLSYDKMKSRYRGYDFVYSNRYHGDYKSDMLTLQDKISIGKHWDNQFTYRRNKVKTNYFQDYDMNAQSNWGISSDYTYDIIGEQVSFHDEWNRLTFGVDYSKGRDNVLRAAGFDVNGNPVKTNHWYENYSFYIQEDWNFLPRWSLSGGLRHDRPETDQYTADFSNHTSKSYRLSYEITPKDTVYAGRNDFYILPGLDVLYIPQYGNAKVRPAYGYTDTVGYSHVFSDKTMFTFNWFRTKDEQSIGYDTSSKKYKNFNQGVSRGWNAQLISQIGSKWSANVGWAHLYSNVPGDNFSLGYSPKDKLTFDMIYHNKKFTGGLDGFYFIRRKNPVNSDLKGWPNDKYGIYNLSFNYEPRKDFNFYLKINNIFDKLWAEHTDVIWSDHTPGTWYSMPGRTWLFGVKMEV